MKTQLIRLLTALAFCASLHQAAAQGTAFTYQGQLMNGASPASGTYDMTFALYNASTGGSQTGPFLTNNAVGVTNGLFTVSVDFGAAFTVTPYWLQIGVRTNGAAAFTTLTPRQQLTPTPYAIFAETANAAGLSGTIPAGDFSGTYGGALTLNNAGNSFTGNGTGLTNVNAGLLGGLATSNFWQTAGNAGTSAGGNFLGTKDSVDLVFKAKNVEGLRLTTSQSLVLQRPSQFSDFSERNGLGVYGFSTDIDTGYRLFANQNVLGPVLYGEGGGGLGVISSTSQQTLALQWGSAAVIVNLPLTLFGATTIANNLSVSGTVTATGFANTGAGPGDFFAGPSAGNSTMTGQYNTVVGGGGLFFNTTGSNNVATGSGALLFNTTGNYNTANGSYALGGATITGVGNTGNGANALYELTSGYNNVAAGYQSLYADTGGFDNVGIGVATLQANATGFQNTALGTYAFQLTTAGNGNIGLGYSAGKNLTSGDNNIYIGNLGNSSESGIIRIGTSGTQTKTYIAGTIENPTCNAISITGGSDLAEPFNITTTEQPVSEGEVVVIDEANPGQLKLTDQPYDTHVAGVVSGANGVHPGIQMHQEGVLEGGKNVALSGRVYVQADTSNGAIKPGDLLTTSTTPGHAMRVSNHARAAGAILGKAMTSLSEGKGMVLVLVTLQ